MLPTEAWRLCAAPDAEACRAWILPRLAIGSVMATAGRRPSYVPGARPSVDVTINTNPLSATKAKLISIDATDPAAEAPTPQAPGGSSGDAANMTSAVSAAIVAGWATAVLFRTTFPEPSSVAPAPADRPPTMGAPLESGRAGGGGPAAPRLRNFSDLTVNERLHLELNRLAYALNTISAMVDWPATVALPDLKSIGTAIDGAARRQRPAATGRAHPGAESPLTSAVRSLHDQLLVALSSTSNLGPAYRLGVALANRAPRGSRWSMSSIISTPTGWAASTPG